MTQSSSQAVPQVEKEKQPIFSWADLSMLTVVVIWGVNFTVVKQTLSEIYPMAFAAIRFSLATVFIVVVLHARGEVLRFNRDDSLKVLILGLLGIAACQTFFIQGIARTTAGNASLLVGTTPIFVTIMSALLHIERISPMGGVGVGLSFVGTALIVGASAGGISASDETLIGNLLILASSASWSMYTLVAQSLMRRYSPLKVTSLAMLMGTPFLLLLSAGEIIRQPWASVSTQGWLGVCYSFVLATALAFVIWNSSVRKVGNTRTAIFSNLIPIVAVTVSWLLLGETLIVWQIIGAVVALTGVTLARLAPRTMATE